MSHPSPNLPRHPLRYNFIQEVDPGPEPYGDIPLIGEETCGARVLFMPGCEKPATMRFVQIDERDSRAPRLLQDVPVCSSCASLISGTRKSYHTQLMTVVPLDWEGDVQAMCELAVRNSSIEDVMGA